MRFFRIARDSFYIISDKYGNCKRNFCFFVFLCDRQEKAQRKPVEKQKPAAHKSVMSRKRLSKPRRARAASALCGFVQIVGRRALVSCRILLKRAQKLTRLAGTYYDASALCNLFAPFLISGVRYAALTASAALPLPAGSIGRQQH